MGLTTRYARLCKKTVDPRLLTTALDAMTKDRLAYERGVERGKALFNQERNKLNDSSMCAIGGAMYGDDGLIAKGALR